jgi:hypothetical protein
MRIRIHNTVSYTGKLLLINCDEDNKKVFPMRVHTNSKKCFSKMNLPDVLECLDGILKDL